MVVVLVAGSLVPGVSDSARATMLIAALVTPGIAILLLRQWIALPLQGVAASLGPEQIGQPLRRCSAPSRPMIAVPLSWQSPKTPAVPARAQISATSSGGKAGLVSGK